jgi:hypothetical protein
MRRRWKREREKRRNLPSPLVLNTRFLKIFLLPLLRTTRSPKHFASHLFINLVVAEIFYHLFSSLSELQNIFHHHFPVTM